ncbi:11244_t:CDS:2, partial [Scutellospora calospora]
NWKLHTKRIIMFNEDIDDEPFIPKYLKGTYIDIHNQNSERYDLLYLPTRFDDSLSMYIGVGFSDEFESRLRILPGWYEGTMGYHGDDGCKFDGEGLGQRYGPLYSTGDTIGCCINFVDNNVFYTKNGINLGIAFENKPNEDMFPIVGMRTRGESVEANFGMSPFKFDIDTYTK